MSSKPPIHTHKLPHKPFASMIDGPTLTVPTLNPLRLNREVELRAEEIEKLSSQLAAAEARSVPRATPTEFREEERREFRRHVAEILDLRENTIPMPRPTARINFPGDSIWISLDSFGGEVWSGSDGLHVHRAAQSSASFILLQRPGATVAFSCNGGPGTYLFVARVETRQRTLRATVLENSDCLATHELQLTGDKALVLVEFGKGGWLTASYVCGGHHAVKIFGVEAYRVQ